LDLVGGTHVAFEADMSQIEDSSRNEAIKSLVDVFDRRINALGVAEPVIQSRKIGNEYGIVVELPGITDTNEALDTIGKTAQLNFKQGGSTESLNLGSGEFSGEELQQIQQQQKQGEWNDTQLSGKHLKRADVQFDQ